MAAIASVTGSMSDYTYNGCSPDHPTAVMQIHGANDAVIPFDGAYGFRSIPESIDFGHNTIIVILFLRHFNSR